MRVHTGTLGVSCCTRTTVSASCVCTGARQLCTAAHASAVQLQVGLRLGLAGHHSSGAGGCRAETPVAGLIESVGCESLEEKPVQEIVLFDALFELVELVVVVAVIDQHRVSDPYVPIRLESGKTAHPVSSSSIPVGTSAEQLGQVAVAILPTTKVKSHSGHSIFGRGSSGGGGGGGDPAPGTTPGAV